MGSCLLGEMPFKILRNIMNRIILDTNFLLALVDEKDKWRSMARATFDALKNKGLHGIVFDCVANELVSVIGKRLEEAGRSGEFNDVIQRAFPYISIDKIVRTYPLLDEFYEDTLNIVMSHSGKLNFHDALIAIAAREYEIVHILSFDEDFDGIKWLVRIKDINDLENI